MKARRPSFLLTYGAKEDQAFKDIDELSKKGVIPTNRNEILRRGLHCCKPLALTDEKNLLTQIDYNFESLMDSPDPFRNRFSISRLRDIKNLVACAYAVMVFKYGIDRAETFKSFMKSVDSLSIKLEDYRIENESSDDWEYATLPEEFKKELEKLQAVLRTVFIQ